MDESIQHFFKIAKQAAIEAGSYLKNKQTSLKAVQTNARRDVKIKADRHSENMVVKALRSHTSFPILTEESGLIPTEAGTDESTGTTDYQWILDPLDGSLNYSREIPTCCISIALYLKMEPVLGVIYDFNHQELFSGIVGTGAWLNKQSICVGTVKEKKEAILCTGFPVNTDFSSKALLSFVENVRDYKKIRLLGSAALSLAYVAAGRADAYEEKDIKLWDVAAGIALLRAAGGSVRLISGAVEHTYWVHGSNAALMEKSI